MQTVAQLRQWREQSAATTYRQVAEGANETAPSARSKRETFCAAERLRRAAAAALQARTALDTVERGDSITCDFRLPDGMPLTSEALAAGLDVNPELLLKARGEGTSAAALHALLRAIRDRGVAPLLVPLGIWEHGTEGLVRVALDRSGAKASRRELLALAEAGELALVLDAWSGLQPDGRARAAAQIAALRRLYPLLRLVVITTSDRDPPPIAGVCVTALPASASRT